MPLPNLLRRLPWLAPCLLAACARPEPPLVPLPQTAAFQEASPRVNGNVGTPSLTMTPSVSYGTQPAGAQGGTAAEGGDISLDFADTDIRAVVAQILGDLLKVNYAIDPAVHGTATFRSVEPLSRTQLIPVLQMLLTQSGASLQENAGIYHITPASLRILGWQHRHPAALHLRRIAGPGAAADRRQHGQDHRRHRPQRRHHQRYPGRGGGAGRTRPLLRRGPARRPVLRGAARHPPAHPRTSPIPCSRPSAPRLAVRSRTSSRSCRWTRSIPSSSSPASRATSTTCGASTRWCSGAAPDGAKLARALFAEQRGQRRHLRAAAGLHARQTSPRSPRSNRPTRRRPAQSAAATPARAAARRGATSGLPVSGSPSAAPTGGAPDLSGASNGGSGPSPIAAAPTGGRSGAATSNPLLGGLDNSSGGGAQTDAMRIIPNPQNNAVLVYSTAQEEDTVEAMVRKIDLLPLQVKIDATIAEVDLNDALQYGTQFFFKSGGINGILSTATSPSPPRTWPPPPSAPACRASSSAATGSAAPRSPSPRCRRSPRCGSCPRPS